MDDLFDLMSNECTDNKSEIQDPKWIMIFVQMFSDNIIRWSELYVRIVAILFQLLDYNAE